MFTGNQTRAGRKDQVTAGAQRRAARRVQSNGLDNARRQLASNGPHSPGHIVISTEARMPELTEINDPATIAGQQVLVGGVDGADRPGNWQERDTHHLEGNIHGCPHSPSIRVLLCIWTPPCSRGISYQILDAYVYSAFQWRRYLPALNVCALQFLIGSMASRASKQNRFYRSGYLLSDRGLSLNSSLLAAVQAANG